MLSAAWRQPGFCVPNPTTYPYQWLWDSCFHSITWAELGDDRCVSELTNTLAHQDKDGFVPHMTYWGEPDAHADFWGRSHVSTISQPPMYGHCFAELVRRGFSPGSELADRARRGLKNLIGRPRTQTGLVPVWHPWETGCDDSARWDDWVRGDGFTAENWRAKKSEFVFGMAKTSEGAVAGSDFEVGSVGFNALVAWNVLELAAVGESDVALDAAALVLIENIGARWNHRLLTWTDADVGSGQALTLDAMLCTLVDPRPEAFEQLINPEAFGAPFGPSGAHIGSSTYDPDNYWRGPAWPQLSYLLYKAAVQCNHECASELARALVAGAKESGLSEFWNPETGQARGATPQTWAGLAICVGR